MFKKTLMVLIGLQFLTSPFLSAQENNEKPAAYLLSVGGHPYRFQRIGTFTYFLCGKKDSSEDCQKIGAMDLQSSVDWDALVKQARKKSLKEPSGVLVSETVVDQYGGPWKIELKIATAADQPQDFLKPFHATIRSGFRGYEVIPSPTGDTPQARVLVKKSEWDAAKKDLGLVPAPKKKFSFGDLFR